MTVLPSSSRARIEELDGVPLLAFIPGADFGVPAVVLMEQSNTVGRYQRRIGLAGAWFAPYSGAAPGGSRRRKGGTCAAPHNPKISTVCPEAKPPGWGGRFGLLSASPPSVGGATADGISASA